MKTNEGPVDGREDLFILSHRNFNPRNPSMKDENDN
jgi:hypothetical protein